MFGYSQFRIWAVEASFVRFAADGNCGKGISGYVQFYWLSQTVYVNHGHF